MRASYKELYKGLQTIRNRIIGHLTDPQDTDHDVLWSCAVLAGSLAPDATAPGRAASREDRLSALGYESVPPEQRDPFVRPMAPGQAAEGQPGEDPKGRWISDREWQPDAPEPAGGQWRCPACGSVTHEGTHMRRPDKPVLWVPTSITTETELGGSYDGSQQDYEWTADGLCPLDPGPQPAEAAPGGIEEAIAKCHQAIEDVRAGRTTSMRIVRQGSTVSVQVDPPTAPTDPGEELRSRVANLLRELEWSGCIRSGAQACPACQRYRIDRRQHAPDCELATVLGQLDALCSRLGKTMPEDKYTNLLKHLERPLLHALEWAKSGLSNPQNVTVEWVTGVDTVRDLLDQLDNLRAKGHRR
jgi:hypothetical protein